MMDRRSFIAAAPATLIAPVAVSAGEVSPFPALYADWISARAHYNSISDDDWTGEVEAEAMGRLLAAERHMAEAEPKTARDMAFKIVVADDCGDFECSTQANALLAEARALIGEA